MASLSSLDAPEGKQRAGAGWLEHERREPVMAKASQAQAHVCSTCGKVTTKKGHLCTPVPIEDATLAVCEYCGMTATDPRHVCFPKRVELSYFCESCGRVATTRSLLCKPRSLPNPKKGTVRGKESKGKSKSRK